MARTKALILFTAVTLLISSGSALRVQVSIDSITSADVKNFQFQTNTSGLQEANASVMNTGSIGCQYQLGMDYSYRNDTYSAYSEKKALWPGASALAEIRAPVINYTGPVNSTLSVQFCDRTQQLENFTFNSTENITLNETVDTRTVQASETKAEIKTDVEQGRLVPVQTPTYWKVPDAEIKNGTADISYEAPIFDERENLTYMVKSGGETLGTTKVELRPQKTVLEKLMAVDQRRLYILIVVLASINISLLYRTLTDTN